MVDLFKKLGDNTITVCRMCAIHESDWISLPGTPYYPHEPPGVIPDF